MAFALGGKATVTAGAAASATVAALALTPVLPANTTDSLATAPPSDMASVQPSRLPESSMDVRVDEALPEVFQRAGAFSLDLTTEEQLLTIDAPTPALPFTEVVGAVPTAALPLDEVPELPLEAADAPSLLPADSAFAPLD